MSDPATPPDEADLQAFIDDRLDPARRAEIAARLDRMPHLRRRVEQDRALTAALRQDLAREADHPVPSTLRVAALRAVLRMRARQRLIGAARAAAIFLAGGLGGLLAGGIFTGGTAGSAPPPAVAGIAREAVAAHRLFVVEVAHPVEVGAEREQHLLTWLSRRLGRPLAAPDLGRFGFRLVGGRLLPGSAGAAAQLMYETEAGARLTLYVEATTGEGTAFRFERGGGTASFAWIDEGLGFAVTAPLDRAQLEPIAEAIYHAFYDGGDRTGGAPG